MTTHSELNFRWRLTFSMTFYDSNEYESGIHNHPHAQLGQVFITNLSSVTAPINTYSIITVSIDTTIAWLQYLQTRLYKAAVEKLG